MASHAAPSLRLASAPFEVLAVQEQDGIPLHVVPSDHPAIQEEAKQEPLCASCYTRDALVLVLTPFEDSNTLELRTFSFHSNDVNATPHHIQFPAPLLPDVYLAVGDSDDVLILQACTVTGFAYRFSITLPLLQSVDDIPNNWFVEQRLTCISADLHSNARDRVITSMHCSDDGQLMLVACSDGRVAKLAWEQAPGANTLDGHWRESVLRPNSFFGRLFGRSGSINSPSHVLSIATFARSHSWTGTLGFTISQDRRLRVWDLGSDACIRTIELPRSMLRSQSSSSDRELALARSDPTDASEDGSMPASLGRAALIRAFSLSHDDASSPYAFYLVVFVPASFASGPFLACYGVQLEAISSSSSRQFAGSVGDIDLLWERRCDDDVNGSDIELRDMCVVTGQGSWDVWCVWDAAGRTLVKQTRVEEHSFDERGDDVKWSSVSLPASYSPLHGRALERDLEVVDDPSHLGSFFVDRITEPGRFTYSSLEQTIKAYEDVLLARNEDPAQLPSTTSSHYNLREQIIGLVGCTITMKEDTETGAPLHDDYLASLKREWAVFLSLLARIDNADRWPIAFAKETPRANLEEQHVSPFVVSRGLISIPVREDEAAKLLRDTKSTTESSEEATLVALLQYGLRLREIVGPYPLQNFENGLLEILVRSSSDVVEESAADLWSAYVLPALVDDEDQLKEDFAVFEDDVISLLQQASLMLQGQESVQGTGDRGSKAARMTELLAAFTSDALTQFAADRQALVKILLILTVGVKVGFLQTGTDVMENASVDDIVVSAVVAFHRLSALIEAAHFEGIVEAAFTDPAFEDDAADADTVAKKIGQLQFVTTQPESKQLRLDAAAANLVHKSLLFKRFRQGDPENASLALRITQAAIDALDDLTNAQEGFRMVELGRKSVEFANQALLSGHPSAAMTFVKMFPPTPAGDFIIARCLIAMDDVKEAGQMFDKVLKTFDHLAEERSALGSGLLDIVPFSIRDVEDADEAAFQFCRLAVLYFKRTRAAEQVKHFAIMALSRLSSLNATSSTISQKEVRSTTQDLHLAIFRSCIEMEMYSDAYMHLLANPFDELQRESLRTLISIMCERGLVEQVLSFNFAGLQTEVERTLSFKARNSNPLSDDNVNYYDILYAFHVERGDLKSAGATKWQMGTRINEYYRRKFVHSRKAMSIDQSSNEEELTDLLHFVILEARCYLASINALSLINVKNAWFAHEISDSDDARELSESSRLTSYLPASMFQQRPREVRIVSLHDVRRRYQLLLAQLELCSLYPLESSAIMTTSTSDASSAILFFVRNQNYARAFELAFDTDVDRTQVYIALTDKCLELAHWEDARREQNKIIDGQEEHPLMQALYDDQDVAEAEGDLLSAVKGNDVGRKAPSARFLDQSDRCTSWTGPRSKRAWRYLRLWLSYESDSSQTKAAISNVGHALRYRMAVTTQILNRNMWHLTPDWLTAWLKKHDPEALIRTLMEHSLVLPALQVADEIVRASTAQVTSSTKRRRTGAAIASQTYLPYLLFDVLLKRSEDAPQQVQGQKQAQGSSSLLGQREAAKALRQSIDVHKERLRALEKDVRRNQDEDEARKRRTVDVDRLGEEDLATRTAIVDADMSE